MTLQKKIQTFAGVRPLASTCSVLNTCAISILSSFGSRSLSSEYPEEVEISPEVIKAASSCISVAINCPFWKIQKKGVRPTAAKVTFCRGSCYIVSRGKKSWSTFDRNLQQGVGVNSDSEPVVHLIRTDQLYCRLKQIWKMGLTYWTSKFVRIATENIADVFPGPTAVTERNQCSLTKTIPSTFQPEWNKLIHLVGTVVSLWTLNLYFDRLLVKLILYFIMLRGVYSFFQLKFSQNWSETLKTDDSTCPRKWLNNFFEVDAYFKNEVHSFLQASRQHSYCPHWILNLLLKPCSAFFSMTAVLSNSLIQHGHWYATRKFLHFLKHKTINTTALKHEILLTWGNDRLKPCGLLLEPQGFSESLAR